MSLRTRSFQQIWMLALCLLATGVAFGQTAGKVLLAVGDVAALRGTERVRLTAGAPVNVIRVDDETARFALLALQRMLQVK